MKDPETRIIMLCGPTAVGKTELSLHLAETLSGEIISVDSMQVYRYMDIGTAKPTRKERNRVQHYLIDIADPDENYSLGRFVKDAEEAIAQIYTHKHIPLLTGGTGLYFKGLFEGVFAETDPMPEADADKLKNRSSRIRIELKKKLREKGNEKLHHELRQVDPESAKRIHPNDTQRLIRGLEVFYSTGIPWSRHLAQPQKRAHRYQVLKIGLTRPRQELYQRIDERVQLMVEQGLLAEVKKILAMGYDKNLKTLQAIGYRHMINFLDKIWTWDQALELLARDTRHYAKRQFTWFNNDPEISWYDVRQADAIVKDIHNFLAVNHS